MYNVLVMLQNKKLQQYVDGLLVFESTPRVVEGVDELAWRIWKILTEEKRLARRPDPDFKTAILDKLKRTIERDRPVVMINAFGGFKNYKAPTFPHVDWAEVFALNKLVKQCVKIAAIYKPGVKLEFTGDSEMVVLFNNYPADTVGAYVAEFKQLLDIFQERLPDNVELSYRSLSEGYDLGDLENRVVEAADSITPSEAEELVKKNLSKARNNFMVAGTVDYSRAKKDNFELALRRSVLLDHAYIEIDVRDRREYLEGGLHIPLIQTSIPGCIALKSVGTSKLAFWLGSGYLVWANGRFTPFIRHGQKWHELKNIEQRRVESPFSQIVSLRRVPVLLPEKAL